MVVLFNYLLIMNISVIDKIKEREKEIERLNAMKDSIVNDLSKNGEFEYAARSGKDGDC